ncbi:MAG TPA: hypothetical protein VFF31_13050 [Blastocatellia bacterium]|nr:hypothetical protein [Blastocatellia bacterium]
MNGARSWVLAVAVRYTGVAAWMAVTTTMMAFAPGYADAELNRWSLGVIPPLLGALWLFLPKTAPADRAI